jgi:hypothetical protein
MKLVGCGDSWCWGAELVDPTEEPIPLMKLPGGEFERHFKPVNEAYRLKYRYLNQFASKIEASEIVDLSLPSYSNDAICRRLLDWLAEEGYLEGRDTSELFITIGWTSPERTEFFYKETWGCDNWCPVGPWSIDQPYQNKQLKTFFSLYFENFSNPGGYLHKWITQIWQVEFLLKKLNIKYIMHQAFYHHHLQTIHQWNDEEYLKDKTNTITAANQKMWSMIDPIKFIGKNDSKTGTAHHVMLDAANGDSTKVFEVFHPNATGHTIWAEHMFKYCKDNNLL